MLTGYDEIDQVDKGDTGRCERPATVAVGGEFTGFVMSHW